MRTASFSLLTGRPIAPTRKASNEPDPIVEPQEEQRRDDDKAEAAAFLQALKEQLDGLASALNARMDTMEVSMKAIADKPAPTITVPTPVPPPTINIPPMPSYKKEIDQINATLAVLIARTTPIPNSSPPTKISFDVVRNGLGDVVSLIARRI
jgi:hypothetical protein